MAKQTVGSLQDPQKSKAQEALELAKSNCVELFVDQHAIPYAAVAVNDHYEVLLMSSTRFRSWLCRLFYDNKKLLLNGEDVTNALNVLKAETEFSSNQKHLHLRVASDSFAIYYDLTNNLWEAIRIDSDGWKLEKSPGLFVRYNNQQSQVYPARNYEEDIFDRFFALTNVRTEDDKLLLKCYIVSLFVPEIPKPVLMLHGEQGAAKSTLQEFIKMLVDPSSIKTLSFPRDINELVQKLSHNYVAYFDNVSHIREWISDELCKAVTGSGFSKRQLYTNDDDVIYNFKRCIGFNGISLGATKADLLDRGLIIQLARIPTERRRKVREIWTAFEEIRPKLLCYIFDILSKGLKLQKEQQVDLKELPRMADFAEIAEIISRSIGYPDGAFLTAYYKNIGLQTEEAIEANSVAIAITKLMEERTEWAGTVTQFLYELEQVAAGLKINTSKADAWPKAPNSLSRRLNEVVTNLREIGLVVERRQDTRSNTRHVEIRKISPVSLGPPRLDTCTQEKSINGEDTGDAGNAEERFLPMSQGNKAKNCVQDGTSGDTGDSGDIVRAFACPYECGQTFPTLDGLQTHGVIYHPGRPITADFSKEDHSVDQLQP
jgi:hypothetical protein